MRANISIAHMRISTTSFRKSIKLFLDYSLWRKYYFWSIDVYNRPVKGSPNLLIWKSFIITTIKSIFDWYLMWKLSKFDKYFLFVYGKSSNYSSCLIVLIKSLFMFTKIVSPVYLLIFIFNFILQANILSAYHIVVAYSKNQSNKK